MHFFKHNFNAFQCLIFFFYMYIIKCTFIPSTADETFAMVSVSLLEKKRRLENKFHLLQLKESMVQFLQYFYKKIIF